MSTALTTDFPADHRACDAHRRSVGGDPSSSGHPTPDTQEPSAAAPTSPNPASSSAAPKVSPPGSGTPGTEQATPCASPNDGSPARAPLPPAPASASSTPIGQALVLAGTDRPQGPATVTSVPSASTPGLADPLLALAADVLDDLERVRIANENRLRQLTRTEEDSDGLERGFGLPVDHPDVKRLAALVEGLATAEHQAELNLRRLLRQHPLGPWVKQARGVGEKQAARLLAAVGDPYWNTLHNRPRTVSELWAYSGYHVIRTGQRGSDTHAAVAGSEQSPAGQRTVDTQSGLAGGAPAGGNPDQRASGAQDSRVGVAATRARGQKANWSATAKMRAHLVAVSIVKAGGPYREVYDSARAKYDGDLHATECRRCGPAGKPAAVGSPLSAGHQHARALRAVAKEVLKDLWREAQRIHDQHAP